MISNALLKARGLEVGDSVTLSVQHDPERKPPELPEDVHAALRARPNAMKNFRAMTVSWQRQMVRYVDKDKSPDTREKYIEILIERVNEHAEKQAARKTRQPSTTPKAKATSQPKKASRQT